MLKLLRKKGVAKKILWFTAVIIILSFGVFGTANYLGNNSKGGAPSHAGKIFGKKISIDQFQTSLLHLRNQAILLYGDNFSKISQYLDLESQAWDRLVLLEEIKKRNIKVSDEEVIRTIENFSFFQSNGKFSRDLYEKIVRHVFECRERDFEESIRESLAISKLSDQETSSLAISDDDIHRGYKEQNEKVQVSFTTFTADDYKKETSVSLEETQKYYDENKNSFLVPPTINIEYLLIPFAPDTNSTEPQNITEKMQNVAAELKTNPNFGTTAKKYQCESGESGFFSEEAPNLKIGWPYEVLQKAFELEGHEISEPIETGKGYYILRLKEKKGSYVPEYSEVAEKVTDAVIAIKAGELAKQKAEEHLKQIREITVNSPDRKFADIAKDLNLSTAQTPLFNRGQYLDKIGISKEFQDAAFALNEQNKISEVIEAGKGYCILGLDIFSPVDEEKFKTEKEEFAKKLKEQKKSQMFADFMERLRIKADVQDNVSDLYKKKTKTAY